MTIFDGPTVDLWDADLEQAYLGEWSA